MQFSADYSRGYNDAVRDARNAIDLCIENIVASDDYSLAFKESLCEAQDILKNAIPEEEDEEEEEEEEQVVCTCSTFHGPDHPGWKMCPMHGNTTNT